MKLSERIHEALSERMLSRFHKVRTVLLKIWFSEAIQLEGENEALRLAAIRYLRNSYAKAGMMNLYNELDALLVAEEQHE